MSLKERPRLQEPELYQDKLVRFSLSSCDIANYCIQRLEKKELAALYRRLGHFESMTWGQAVGLAHEKGISIDKRDGAVHGLLSLQMPGITTFGHFRVNGVDANVRVFVGRDRDLARIRLIDREGRLQH